MFSIIGNEAKAPLPATRVVDGFRDPFTRGGVRCNSREFKQALLSSHPASSPPHDASNRIGSIEGVQILRIPGAVREVLRRIRGIGADAFLYDHRFPSDIEVVVLDDSFTRLEPI